MRIHIVGICGTFMGGLALLAHWDMMLPVRMPTSILR